MTFADLFKPKSPEASGAPDLRSGRSGQFPTLTQGEKLLGGITSEVRTHDVIYIGEESGVLHSVHSAPARPPLVPLETPWTEGGRYQFAHCFDLRRLPLFVADPAGDTRRAHGCLIHDPL
jgi:hypothetical protein